MAELSTEQISKLTTKVIEEGYSLTRSECLLVLEALADTTTRATTAEAERDDLQISLRKIIAELIRVQITANELRVERDTATTRAEKAEAERDRQYEFNTEAIAKIAALEDRWGKLREAVAKK